MKKLFLSLILGLITIFFSCKKEDKKECTHTHSKLTGIIKKPEGSFYQYGSHTLTTNWATYALKSTTVDLDQYLNRSVEITGDKVDGYPVDFGPELIDVKTVK